MDEWLTEGLPTQRGVIFLACIVDDPDVAVLVVGRGGRYVALDDPGQEIGRAWIEAWCPLPDRR